MKQLKLSLEIIDKTLKSRVEQLENHEMKKNKQFWNGKSFIFNFKNDWKAKQTTEQKKPKKRLYGEKGFNFVVEGLT